MRSWPLWLAAVAVAFCVVATGTSTLGRAAPSENQATPEGCSILLTSTCTGTAPLARGAVSEQGQTCTPVLSPPSDVTPPDHPFRTGVDVIARFNFARQREDCQVSLSIDPAAY